MIVTAQEASSGTFQRPRWEPGEAAGRAPRAGHNPLRFGIDTGLWFANWSTRVDTPTSPHKTSSGPVVFLAPRIDMDLSPDWRGTLRFEIGEASDLDTKVVAFRLSRPVYDMGDGVVRFHAGPAAASLDAHRFPGSFRDAVGFDLGVDGEAPLWRHWLFEADLTVRYMKFDYSRPPEVVSANDHSLGPVGVLFSIGATYDF